jgi:hypothetical protein
MIIVTDTLSLFCINCLKIFQLILKEEEEKTFGNYWGRKCWNIIEKLKVL